MWPSSDPPGDDLSLFDASQELNDGGPTTSSPFSHRLPSSTVANTLDSPREVRFIKGKDKASLAPINKREPLRMLDLPVDILREIIGQLPHTNDLTSLALCHPVFHALCIPCIYSRFDIVWPDASVDTASRAGVDALTYGLATLVMAEEVFGRAPWQQRLEEEHEKVTGAEVSMEPYPLPKRRIGNNYARYTKKFSLGNGPAEWVQEYLISKEGGKMLGTLVALAVARMRNLESFTWDMPTGVLRDVWLSLSSLADTDDGQDCRLEKIWIRWHNNSQDHSDGLPPPPPPPPQLNNLASALPIPHGLIGGLVSAAMNPANPALPAIPTIDRVEYPTFSVLPPLKSVSVLDIDELAYLDELSILIARSQRRLRELRIGIAEHAHSKEWVSVWEGEGVQQVDYNSPWTIASKISEKRLGGVLGTLVGRVYNLRNNGEDKTKLATSSSAPAQPTAVAPSSSKTSVTLPQPAETETEVVLGSAAAVNSGSELGAPIANGESHSGSERAEPLHKSPKRIPLRPAQTMPFDTVRKNGPYLNGKLRLETLELERVPLSLAVLQKAFDWSRLTNLTLLDCRDHELLWRVLRRHYSPTSPYNRGSTSETAPSRKESRFQYPLNIKKIHTNTVSAALVRFLRETLAENSLEMLFLQESPDYTTSVTIDALFWGPVKRHRSSLKKLMIDSSGGEWEFGGSSSRWKRWMLKRDHITLLASGQMRNLRELGVTLEYSDWHEFLRLLPRMSNIRSLYIPRIADHPHGANIDLRDLALHILNIVAIRPEVELCYVGIASKCFEILENKPSGNTTRDENGAEAAPAPTTVAAPALIDVDDEDELEVDDEPDDLDDDFDDSLTESDADFDTDLDVQSPKLHLREILFYDDKISVFRARHGRL